MDRRGKVELLGRLRRGYVAGDTIQRLPQKHGLHRLMVAAGDQPGNPTRADEGYPGAAETRASEGGNRGNARVRPGGAA